MQSNRDLLMSCGRRPRTVKSRAMVDGSAKAEGL